jgi:PBP1b-binding outer membrane lipoprotein LpoB
MKTTNRFIQIILTIAAFFIVSCGSSSSNNDASQKDSKHHLNIPANGIESMMEANSQKIIEGSDGSIIISVGEIVRKKVDISIRKNDKILDERLLAEKESISFQYEDRKYTVLVKNIRKPLIGAGKAEISIQ